MNRASFITNSYFYKSIHQEDWYVDIIQKSDCYEIWLYKEPYSHKMFIVGLPTTVYIRMETVELIAESILNNNIYIARYDDETNIIESLLTFS